MICVGWFAVACYGGDWCRVVDFFGGGGFVGWSGGGYWSRSWTVPVVGTGVDFGALLWLIWNRFV